ncbi:glycerol-3-phosphate 1-O-acyltransferase PlsY [Thermodesulfobacteriota bacterium]
MTILKMAMLLGLPIFAYLFGAIPWGLILTRLFANIDIREQGSGNIGATNVRRTAGTTLGLITLTGDVLKGVLPVYLAGRLVALNSPGAEIYTCLVFLSAFWGHLFPIYLKFRGGGKGVATAAGGFLVLSPIACLISILVFIMVVCWFNRVSGGSLSAAAVLPLAIWKFSYSAILTGCALIVVLFIYARHKDNILRIMAGTESVFREKKE